MLWPVLIASSLDAGLLKASFYHLPALWRLGIVALGVVAFGTPLLVSVNRMIRTREEARERTKRRRVPLSPEPQASPPRKPRRLAGYNRAGRPPEDRRRALRRSGNPVEVFVLKDNGDPIPAMVLDRSTGGLKLSLPRPVEAHTVLKVLACNAPEGTPWLTILVRHSQPTAAGCVCGCQFVDSPPWSQLLLFG